MKQVTTQTSLESAVIAGFEDEELTILINCLNEALHGPDAIEDWEFHTRIGATREQAAKLLDALTAAVKRSADR